MLALVFGFRERGPDEAAPVVQLFDAWWNDQGIWKFLLFGMQMCLILVTGFALATSGPVRRIIDRLAAVPRGPDPPRRWSPSSRCWWAWSTGGSA